jgi:mRNA interferase HigB
MVIISKAMLRIFCLRHPDATTALNDWYRLARIMQWATFAELRATFNSVDYVGNDRYVFNIKGNRYRLVAMIFFDIRTVYIRFIGTHAEYDRIEASTI